MNQKKLGSVLITGANIGIGKEVARQLAVQGDASRIYLACRDERRAEAAKLDLETLTGKRVFTVIRMDLSDTPSVRAALEGLPALDGLVMNAGGMGGTTPLATTREGVTHVFAHNVLGHVVLLEELLRSGRLTSVGVYVGSEAARGVSSFNAKRPSFPTSSVDEFVRVINGEHARAKKLNVISAYGETKYLAALWMSALARAYPSVRLLTVSPGGTRGTNATKNMPFLVGQFMGKVLMPISGVLGISHTLEEGGKRIVDGLLDAKFQSGVFYASRDGKTIGPVVPQGTVFADLLKPHIQDNAAAAIHQFTPVVQPRAVEAA